MKALIVLTSILLILITQHTHAAGFQRIFVTDPDDKIIEVGVWYPSDSAALNEANTPFRQALALDSPIKPGSHPLILLSHGYGGWMGGHANTAKALAEAGYVAAAPTHTGNNYEDESYPPQRWMLDRPRHIKLTIDHLLNNWIGKTNIDPVRIGIFGFSAGGYTALVSSGGVPNIDKLLTHCEKNPSEIACKLGNHNEAAISDLSQRPETGWSHDPRISAAVVIAPGFGFAFDQSALKKVTLPLQLWSGTNDLNVPTKTNADQIFKSLPKAAEYHLVEDAGHFAFLSPCNPLLEKHNPKVWNMVCVDAPTFNREEFQEKFNEKVIKFFNKNLTTR
ncbi:alpha/beta hydrolase family protein [Kiloniella majae]|uniref:alpha/beta hydrolase family protein n=1 Tax=Kiloniella majae TaxID=1938558 RepID=UPI0015C4FCDE|nr:dienelactone hydrolase family protein [Kiloniella majae]